MCVRLYDYSLHVGLRLYDYSIHVHLYDYSLYYGSTISSIMQCLNWRVILMFTRERELRITLKALAADTFA